MPSRAEHLHKVGGVGDHDSQGARRKAGRDLQVQGRLAGRLLAHVQALHGVVQANTQAPKEELPVQACTRRSPQPLSVYTQLIVAENSTEAAPASKPFHRARGPSSFATVLTVPIKPLRGRLHQLRHFSGEQTPDLVGFEAGTISLRASHHKPQRTCTWGCHHSLPAAVDVLLQYPAAM